MMTVGETPATFPPAYRELTTDHLLDAFRRAPERLRASGAGLSQDELRARPIPEKWSILENLVHVVDSEIVGAVRFRMVVAEPGIELPFYDQDTWTTALDYQSFDAEELDNALTHFEALRRTTFSLLRDLPRSTWKRSGVHAELGPVSLRQLLELYADHAEWHIWRILDLRRRVGRELDFELFLPERLFPVSV